MSEFSGRVAIVTGSSSGIGEQTARRLSALGATVVVNSSSSVESGEAVSASLPGESCYVRADISDIDEAHGLVDATIERYGQLDFLINNAGWTTQVPHEHLDDLTDEIFRWALDFAGDDTRVRAVAAIQVATWLDQGLDRERFGGEIEHEEQRINDAIDEVDPERRADRSIVMQGVREALAEAQASADLVVAGTRGHGHIAAGLLGSVSSWLLHDATVPVVVVPDR